MEHLNSKWIDEKNKLDICKFKSKLYSFEYVSFDLFDTLLKRNIMRPVDIFKLLEIKLKRKGFAECRINAEKKARNSSIYEEVTIKEIYNQFEGITEEEKNFFIKMELEMEYDLLTVNKSLQIVYQYCIQKKKKVFIVTDIYLPQKFIEKILTKLGFDGYCAIYVSSTKRKTKVTGNLFYLLLKEQNIFANQLIHIGDSKHSDYYIPQKLGIKSIHIQRYIKYSEYRLVEKRKNDIRINILNSFINNTIMENPGEYYRFGYERFGMLLWGFCKWLSRNLKENRIKDVYFFSRDGLIMKKAFDIFNENKEIKTHYLEVSRRSLRVPIIWKKTDYKQVMDIIITSKLIHIKTIFDNVGLDIREYIDKLNKYGFTVNNTFDASEIYNNISLQKLYNDILPDIISNSKNEYYNLKCYLKGQEFPEKFAIVDIGWAGSMQRYLKQTINLMGMDIDISGYYMGVAPFCTKNTKLDPGLDLNGYLFDFNHNPEDCDTRSSFVGMFESLFLEQKGSVKKYIIKKDGYIKTERYPYEYEENDKLSFEAKAVMQIQDGALQFIKNIKSAKILNMFSYTPEELFSGIYKAGTNPSKQFLKMFGNFRFYDDGITEKLASPKKSYYYFLHPRHLMKDFLSCRWKIGFLKKMFKINLPYQMIYKLLLKLK